MSRFAVGQLWAYHTRDGESASRVRVLRVDSTPHAGVIVHVAVDGLAIDSIGFMPLSEAALDASVTHLVKEDHGFVPAPDFEDGYRGWRGAFDEGKAGIWTAPVARVVQVVEDGLRRS